MAARRAALRRSAARRASLSSVCLRAARTGGETPARPRGALSGLARSGCLGKFAARARLVLAARDAAVAAHSAPARRASGPSASPSASATCQAPRAALIVLSHSARVGCIAAGNLGRLLLPPDRRSHARGPGISVESQEALRGQSRGGTTHRWGSGAVARSAWAFVGHAMHRSVPASQRDPHGRVVAGSRLAAH